MESWSQELRPTKIGWPSKRQKKSKQELIQSKENKDLPECQCGVGFDQNGPAYFHLGHSSTMEDLKKEQEIKFETKEIVTVPVFYKYQNLETLEGCPSFPDKPFKGKKKVLICTKCQPRHMCE